mmetsp:Transcript_41298/g.66937  ORF Transcript_41298/g.66937 Transcript_41298/m.66937 type:complete len:207 (-) Transcript_41298:471-1091(-)
MACIHTTSCTFCTSSWALVLTFANCSFALLSARSILCSISNFCVSSIRSLLPLASVILVWYCCNLPRLSCSNRSRFSLAFNNLFSIFSCNSASDNLSLFKTVNRSGVEFGTSAPLCDLNRSFCFLPSLSLSSLLTSSFSSFDSVSRFEDSDRLRSRGSVFLVSALPFFPSPSFLWSSSISSRASSSMTRFLTFNLLLSTLSWSSCD